MSAVSCASQGEVNVFTANWLTQVSFEPPLIAVSVENTSKSLPMILRSRIFTVNVLREGGRELAGKLGKSAIQHPEKLSGIEYDLGANGCPILREALAWIACEVRHTAPAGDSTGWQWTPGATLLLLAGLRPEHYRCAHQFRITMLAAPML